MKKSSWVALIVALVVACPAWADAGGRAGARDEDHIRYERSTGCWVAQCYLHGWTLHWQKFYPSYREAEAARAEHERDNRDGHQTIVDTCE
jgi:hypothetical protein